ncbi:MAG: PAS domain S-box protein, partial [Nitrospiraceae bacterium]|nr:PAS domain S-box protein [Nitrospiraceae bacterium]
MIHDAVTMAGHYDFRYVVISVVIAIASSYIALDLAARVTASRGRTRYLWLTGGACSMGIGIWSMHFIGMLAFSLPIPIAYHIPLVALSLLAAVLAALTALMIVSDGSLSFSRLMVGSVLMGSGIVAMHYTGMAAMRLNATTHYDLWLWILSAAVAIGLSFVALTIVYHLRDEGSSIWDWRKICAAVLMGCAIPSMHYIGMAAVTFTQTANAEGDWSWTTKISVLGAYVAVISPLLILALTLVTSLIDRRLSAQASELYVSEEKFRNAFTNASIGMALIGTDTQFLRVNHALCQLIGYSERELLALSYHAVTYSDDLDVNVQEFRRLLTGELDHVQTEIRHVHKQGQIVWGLLSMSLMRDAKATPLYVIAQIIDITERKVSFQKNFQVAERLDLASRAAKIGVWDWNIQKNCLEWNEQMFELYGIQKEDFCNNYDAWLSSVFPDDKAIFDRAIQKALNREEPYNLSFRVNWPDGSLHFLKAHAEVKWDQNGGPLRMTGINYDITEQKRAEEELKLRDVWQKAVLDCAGYAIIATTPDGIIQTFNPAAEQMLGYTAEEVIGKITPAVIHDPEEVADRAKIFSEELGEQIEPGFEVFVAKARKNLPNEHEWTYIKKDGGRFFVLLSVTALRISSGTIVGFLGMAQNITERKRAETERKIAEDNLGKALLEMENQNLMLEVAHADALEATRIKSQFLATMSHEIRTPMNGVIGMTGLLLDTELTPEQRGYAETVRSSGEHLLMVLNDILDFSKIEAGKMTLETFDFDIRSTVGEVMNLLAERAFSKGLNLACLFHADVPNTLRGDPGRLRLILLNLIGNALKFTEQGEVAVSVTLVAQTDDACTIRFEVQDTG